MRIAGGYLDTFDQHFPPGGTTIIGEHGSGKSTLLTHLRFCLDLPVPPASALAHEQILAANLGTGRVYVTFETAADGVLTFSRANTRPKDKPNVPHEPPRFEAEHSRPGPPVAWSPGLFPLHFSGHGELAFLATDGRARLALLERFAGPELRQTRAELARVHADLDGANRQSILRVEAALDVLQEATGPLDGEVLRLQQIKAEAGADPVALEAANAEKALRERERIMLEAVRREVDAVSGDVARLVSVSVRRLSQCADPEVARGPNAALLESVSPDLARITAALSELAGAAAGLCESARGSFAARATALAAAHSRQEDEYRALLGKHEHDAGRALERVKLEARVAELKKREEQETLAHERRELETVRDRLRARQAALVGEERAILRGVAEALTRRTEGAVVVRMEHDVDRSGLAALLADMVKGRKFEGKHLEAIAQNLGPLDLFQQIADRDPRAIAQHVGNAVAERFIAVVRERSRQYDLETVPPADLPAMFLVHGEEKKRHDELSSGQRIATFVRLMLLDRRGPFVADTPETDVSAYHLAMQLCPALADLSAHGQYIIVSHSANVPILGASRVVIELHSPNGRSGVVREAGPPKEVVVPMENHLEGGREAFARRKQFYEVG
jgi:hypothetical protein